MDLIAIRRAIEEVERAAEEAGGSLSAAGQPALERLYSAYAQGVLAAHGIAVDLDELCCQSCRSCPPAQCFRERTRRGGPPATFLL